MRKEEEDFYPERSSVIKIVSGKEKRVRHEMTGGGGGGGCPFFWAKFFCGVLRGAETRFQLGAKKSGANGREKKGVRVLTAVLYRRGRIFRKRKRRERKKGEKVVPVLLHLPSIDRHGVIYTV